MIAIFRTIVAITFIISILQVAVYAQTKNVEIKIVNSNGQPAAGVTVYLADGYACFNGITKQDGTIQFEFSGYELLILASDLSGYNKYGIRSYAPKYTAESYTVAIPDYPKTSQRAGEQLDHFLEALATYHEVHSMPQYWPQSVYHLNNNLQSTLGVPGVFSVSPVPERMEDGRLGLRISGILVEPILHIAAPLLGPRHTYIGQI